MTQKLVHPTALRNNNQPASVLNKNSSALTPVIHQSYLHAATSNNTREAYQTDIRHFIRWGGFLPTTPDIIMQYLEQQARHLNPRTLVRRLTAIKNWHLYQGFADPTANPTVRKTLTGIKNVHGKPKEKAPPLTLETLVTLVNYLNASPRLIDCRNAALLQIGFFGAFRRSELAMIQWENIHFVSEGIEILIPRSKTDQAGEGHVCAIPSGDDVLCPVTALTHWREQSRCSANYVFRQMTKGDQVKENGIKPHQINMIIKSVAQACELPDAELYSSHSLRRGFATEASRKGAPFGSIMRQGRWRHEGTVLAYIDEGKRFDQNAADVMFDRTKNTE